MQPLFESRKGDVMYVSYMRIVDARGVGDEWHGSSELMWFSVVNRSQSTGVNRQ